MQHDRASDIDCPRVPFKGPWTPACELLTRGAPAAAALPCGGSWLLKTEASPRSLVTNAFLLSQSGGRRPDPRKSNEVLSPDNFALQLSGPIRCEPGTTSPAKPFASPV